MTCPTDEILALFAAGDLDPETRNAVLAHLATCNDCMSAVAAASAHLAEEKTASHWWIGAVAAALVVGRRLPRRSETRVERQAVGAAITGEGS